MSLKQKALAGSFWAFAQTIGIQLLSFIVSLVLTRMLLPEEFGLIAMIAVFIGIGKALVDGGLGQSLIRISKPTQKDYSTVFFFNLLGSIIIYLIIYIIAPFIADFYSQEILVKIIRYYSVVIIINAFSMIQITKLIKELNFKTQMLVSIPSIILGGTVGIILALKDFGVWSLVGMAIVQSLANTIQLWIYTKWRPSLIFNIEAFKYHFNYGYKLTLSGLLDIIFVNAYSIIIGKYFAPAQAGFYQRANSLKQLPVSNISSVLNKVTFPLFAEIKNDNVRLKKVFKKMMQMVIYIIAPILIFGAVLAEPLFRFLFTEKWLPAVPYFQILCAVGILHPLSGYNLTVLKVKGRSDLVLKLAIIKKSLMTIVILSSIQFGIYGLLYGQVFLSLIAFCINSYYSGKLLSYSLIEQLKDILPIIIMALVCGSFVYLVDNLLNKGNHLDIIRLLLSTLLGVISYLLIGYFLKINSFVEIKNILLNKFKK